MPAPTNTTPETALDVTSLPYAATLTVDGLSEGLTNVPSCVARAWAAVWFKFTPTEASQPLRYVAAVKGPGSSADYRPTLSIWTGEPGALTELVSSEGEAYCIALGSFVGYYYIRLPVTAGVTYYAQVVHGGATDAPASSVLAFDVSEPAAVEATAGAVVITDDADGFPAAVVDEVSGAFERFVSFPAGELADTNPLGSYCAVNGAASTGVAFFDSQLAEVAAVSFAPSYVAFIKSDRNGHFYIGTYPSPDFTLTVHKYTQLGVLVWSKLVPSPITAQKTYAAAVSQDGARLYCASVVANTPLLVYNFETEAQETDLAVGTANEQFQGSGDGFALADGTLVFMKTHTVTGAIRVVLYHPTTGAQLHTWTPSVATYANHYCYYDESSLMLWGYVLPELNQNAVMERIALADGSTISAAQGIPVSGRSGLSEVSAAPDAISNSCPLFVLTATLDAPPLPPAPAVCITAPVSVACWSGGTPGALGCADAQTGPTSAGCWSGHTGTEGQISLHGEGQP